ncbi:15237_t:CDS:2, partial [Acaulospora colombiana]
AKWETRDDAAQARSFFATIPFICCTWAHTTFQDATATKETYESMNEISKNKKARLNNEDFPSLTEAGTISRLPKHESKHARSLSDESNIPITPVSLRDLSPEVVSPDENTLIPSHEISARLSVLENTSPVTQEYTSQDNNARFDLTTLYITVRLSTYETEVLSDPFLEKEFGAAFVSFGNIEGPEKAIRTFRDGQRFTLDGHTLHLKYKKFKPFIPRKGQSSPRNVNTRVEDGNQPSPLQHPISQLEANSSPRNLVEPLPHEVTLSTKTEMMHTGTDDGYIRGDTTHDTSEQQSQAQSANQVNSIATSVDVPIANPSTFAASPAPGVDANTKAQVYYPYPTTAWPHPYGQYGHPYAAYQPMYVTQPYAQPYWFPSGIVPVAVNTMASHHGQSTSATNNYSIPAQAPASFALGNQTSIPRGPIVPIGCYRHPNGSITYVYPSEVVEKYKSEHKDAHNSTPSRTLKDFYATQAAFRAPQPAMMPMYPGVYPQDATKLFAPYAPAVPYPVSHGTSGTANYGNTSGQEGGVYNLASNAAVAPNGSLNSLGMSGVRATGFGGTSPQAQQPTSAVNAFAGQAGYVPGPQYAPFHYNGDSSQHAYNGANASVYGVMAGGSEPASTRG